MKKQAIHLCKKPQNYISLHKKKEKEHVLHLCFSLLFILGIHQILNAQLSVRNSAYVFVKNEIVFVEDDINLEENASTIYLRNEAQVIQGTGTTGNSGVGELSVYQDGDADAYEFNYWCSPVGSKINNHVNNPFGIKLFNDIDNLTESTPAGYTHNSNLNGTSSPLNIEPFWILKYIAQTDYYGWVDAGSTTTINAGEGFSMKGTNGTSVNNLGANQNYDFRGKPNNGHIPVSVQTGKYSLVGNPYPSAMDAHAYIWDDNNKNTFDGNLYYWTQDPTINSHYLKSYQGGYTTYTISEDELVETISPTIFYTYNGDGTINGTVGTVTLTKSPKRYIPIGQGFMVFGTSNGTINAENSHRVYQKESGGNSAFFKTTNSKKTTTKSHSIFTTMPEGYKRFRLNIDFNNLYTRQLIETFNANTTEGFDRGLECNIDQYDILASDAYWSKENAAYIAEAIPYTEHTKIPLTIKVDHDMPVNIRVADIQNFDSNIPIYLHDKTTNRYVNLKIQDFSIILPPAVYTDRFEVTFKKETTLNIEENDISSLNAFQNNKTHTLKVLNPSNLNIKSIIIYDVSGKQVLSKTPGAIYKTYTLPTNNMSTGMYIVKAILDNKKTFSKKIIIN